LILPDAQGGAPGGGLDRTERRRLLGIRAFADKIDPAIYASFSSVDANSRTQFEGRKPLLARELLFLKE